MGGLMKSTGAGGGAVDPGAEALQQMIAQQPGMADQAGGAMGGPQMGGIPLVQNVQNRVQAGMRGELIGQPDPTAVDYSQPQMSMDQLVGGISSLLQPPPVRRYW